MSLNPYDGRPNIFPAIKYQDAPAAIDWLVRVLGFENQFIVPGANNTIAHAQLKLGPGVIMVGSASKDAVLPQQSTRGECALQSVYIYVSEIDAHYERAKAEGAEIYIPLRNTDYGSREYGVRDREGREWYIGTYYPEAHESAKPQN